jgi:hypothetical protein
MLFPNRLAANRLKSPALSMIKKEKAKLISSFIAAFLAFTAFSFIILGYPVQVVAAKGVLLAQEIGIAKGQPCQQNPDNCQASFVCDSVTNKCSIPIGGVGCFDKGDCVTQATACQQGQNGQQNSCVINGVGGGGIGGGGGTSPVNSTPGVQGAPQCNNDPNLLYKDGVCLPASEQCSDGSLRCTSSLKDLIVKVVKMLLGFAGAIAVVALIIGGYLYISSAGNEEQAEKGKKVIINSIIGLVVIILSYAIVSIVSTALG